MRISITEPGLAARVVQIDRHKVVLGRGESCDIVLGDGKVSRQHARLEVLPDGRVVVQDLDSRNGTLLGGRRVDAPMLVQRGETIAIGDTTLVVVADERVPIEQSAGQSWPTRGAADVSRHVPGRDEGPSPDAQAGGRPSHSAIQRLVLQRSVRRSNFVSVGAIASSLVIAALVLSGALSQRQVSIADVVRAVEQSTVLIVAERDGSRVGSGTGWIYRRDDGYVVTNHHVVNAGTGFQVGRGGSMQSATIVAAAPCEDLALLKVAGGTTLPSMTLGSQAKLRAGDTVVAVGYPVNAGLQDDLVASAGIVSVVQTTFRLRGSDVPQYPNVVQTTAAINPGNSGGPLVTTDNELVGINSAAISGLQNSNYAIGVDRAKEILPELSSGRSRGWTGMMFAEYVTDERLKESPSLTRALRGFGWPDTPGIIVSGSVPGTTSNTLVTRFPALLVAIDGVAMDGTLAGYCDIANRRSSGQVAQFTFLLANSTQPTSIGIAFE